MPSCIKEGRQKKRRVIRKKGRRRRAASGACSPSPAASLICHFSVGRELRCFAVIRGIFWFPARTSDSFRAKPIVPCVFLVRCVDCIDRGHSFGLEPLGRSVISSQYVPQVLRVCVCVCVMQLCLFLHISNEQTVLENKTSILKDFCLCCNSKM